MSFSVEKSLKIEIIQYWTTYIRLMICIHEGNDTPDGVTVIDLNKSKCIKICI